jgi:hypothetical protein
MIKVNRLTQKYRSIAPLLQLLVGVFVYVFSCAQGFATVPAPNQQPLMNVYYSPAVVDVGNASRLHWSTANISRCELLDGTALPLGANGSGKSDLIIEGYTKTTAVRCYSGKGVITRTATLTINGTPPLPVITSFNATPLSVNRGQSVTLSWAATGANSFSLDNSVVIAGNATSVIVTPTQTTIYKLTATGQWGSASQELIVTVVQPDSDADGMPDYWESLYQLNPAQNDALQDMDADGLTNLAEYEANTNPQNADTDADGLPDAYEIHQGLDPLVGSDAILDSDSDGANNLYEFYVGTDPKNSASYPPSQIVDEFRMESLLCEIGDECYARVFWKIKDHQTACVILIPNSVIGCGAEGYVDVPVNNSNQELQIWNAPIAGSGLLSSLFVKKQLSALGAITPSSMGPCEGADQCTKLISVKYQPSSIVGKYSEAATLWRLVDGVWKSWKIVYNGTTDLIVDATSTTGHLFELRVGVNDLQGEMLASYVLWKSSRQDIPALTAQPCEKDTFSDTCRFMVQWNKESLGGEGTEQCLMQGNSLIGCTSGNKLEVVANYPINLQLRSGANISTGVLSDMQLSPVSASNLELTGKPCLADQNGKCSSFISWSMAPVGACIYHNNKLLSCAKSGSISVLLKIGEESRFSMRSGADYASSNELKIIHLAAVSGLLDVSPSDCNIQYPKEKCNLSVSWAVNNIDQACLYSNDELLSCGSAGAVALSFPGGAYKLELRKPENDANKIIASKMVNITNLPWGKISFPYLAGQGGAPINGVSGSNVCILRPGEQTCTVRVQGIFQRAPKNSYATLWRKVEGNWVNYFSRPTSDLFVLDLPTITETSSEFKLTWRKAFETPVSSEEYLLDHVIVRAVKETPYEYSLRPSKTYCYRNSDASTCSINVKWTTNDLRGDSLCVQVLTELTSELIQQVCKPVDLNSGHWNGEYQVSVGKEPIVIQILEKSKQDIKASVKLSSLVGLTKLEVGECVRKSNTRCSVELNWQTDLPNTCIWGGINTVCSDSFGIGHAIIDMDFELSGFLELRAGDVESDLLSRIKVVNTKPKVDLDFISGMQVEAGTLVQLKALVSDPDQQFKSMRFYIDGKLVSPTVTNPSGFGNWVPILPGTYTVRAELADKWGNLINATPKVIQVTPANLPDFDGVRGVSDYGDALLQGLRWTPLKYADALIVNVPNSAEISYNNLSKFNVRRPLKIINRGDSYSATGTAAKLIIIDAQEIQLESGIEIIGEPADILLLNVSASKQILCDACAFKNVGRVTLAVATPSVPMTTESNQVGMLSVQTGGVINLNNLQASGVVSVEVIAEKIDSNGIINTQQYTTDLNAQTVGDVIIPGVSKVVGSGGVSLLHGRLDVDYETLQISEIRAGSPNQELGGVVTSGAINLVSAAPISITANLTTVSELKVVTQYQGKLHAQPEGIQIKTLSADAVSLNTINVNSGLLSDGKVQLTSQGNIHLNSSLAGISGYSLQLNAKGNIRNYGKLTASRKLHLEELSNSDSLIELGANLIENRGSIEIFEQAEQDDKSLGTPKVSGTLTLTSNTDVLNRFGGFIQAKTITIVAQTGRIRNGSLYAFDDSLKENEPIAATGHNTQAISTLSVLPVSDTKPYINPKATIQGLMIHLEAHTSVENINPYTEPVRPGSAEEIDTHVSRTAQAHADDVRIEAVNKLTIVAPQYVLNSSANLGVSEFSLAPALIIESPLVRNERYYSYTVLDTVDETKQVVEQNPGSTSTTTSSIKGVKARYGFYSPPGTIYSFAPVHMQFGVDANNTSAGLLNNAGFIDIYSTMNLFGVGRATSLGVKLDKLAYETTSNTRTVLEECISRSYWNGYSEIRYKMCEQGSYDRIKTPEGKYLEPVLDNTLFAVAGRLDAKGIHFSASNHEVLKDIREQVVTDYITAQKARSYLPFDPNLCKEEKSVQLSSDGLSVSTNVYYSPKVSGDVCPQRGHGETKAVSELVAAKVSNLPHQLNSMISRFDSWKSRAAQ